MSSKMPRGRRIVSGMDCADGTDRGNAMYSMLDAHSKPNCSVQSVEDRADLVKEMRDLIDEGDSAFTGALDRLAKESYKAKWRDPPAKATEIIICRGLGIDNISDVTDGRWELVKSWSTEMAYCWQARKSKSGEWRSEYVGVAGQGPRSTFYKRTLAHISNAFNPNSPEFFSLLSTRLRKVGIERWRVLILPATRDLPRCEADWIRALDTARTKEHRTGLNAVGGEIRLLPLLGENEKGKRVEVSWFLGGTYSAFSFNCIKEELAECCEREKLKTVSISSALSDYVPPKTAECPRPKAVSSADADSSNTKSPLKKKATPVELELNEEKTGAKSSNGHTEENKVKTSPKKIQASGDDSQPVKRKSAVKKELSLPVDEDDDYRHAIVW